MIKPWKKIVIVGNEEWRGGLRGINRSQSTSHLNLIKKT
jgi:hypothetical protein